MRKLKLQVQVSIDGFIAGENGEMDWMTWNWDDDLKKRVQELTDPVDCIVLGRKLAEGFIPYWASVAADDQNPEQAAGGKFTNTYKIVFSKTLEKSGWPNTGLAKGELVLEINALKNQEGGDIIAYGGAAFISSLIREGLIDDYFLFINPVILGRGMPIFNRIESRPVLSLQDSTAYSCGIVVNHYRKL